MSPFHDSISFAHATDSVIPLERDMKFRSPKINIDEGCLTAFSPTSSTLSRSDLKPKALSEVRAQGRCSDKWVMRTLVKIIQLHRSDRTYCSVYSLSWLRTEALAQCVVTLAH